MALNALVHSFCHNQKKCGTERVKILDKSPEPMQPEWRPPQIRQYRGPSRISVGPFTSDKKIKMGGLDQCVTERFGRLMLSQSENGPIYAHGLFRFCVALLHLYTVRGLPLRYVAISLTWASSGRGFGGQNPENLKSPNLRINVRAQLKLARLNGQLWYQFYGLLFYGFMDSCHCLEK